MPIIYQVLVWLGLLAAGGTGGYIATHPEVLTSGSIPTSAWVEVVSDEVRIDDRILKTGDEVTAGAVLTTTTKGSAILHFPDGSAVTVEPDTTLEIKSNLYEEDNKGIVAKIFLKTGKLAFQIVKLATPESLWEVKTGNAVAVVRGTAFSVWFEDGTTSVSVTENAVSVTTLDMATGEPLPDTEVLLTEKKTATVTETDAQAGKAPTVAPSPSPTPTPAPQAVPQTTPAPTPTPATAPSPAPSATPPAAKTPSSSGTSAAATATLTIEGNTRGITDGERVVFKAVATFKDGTKRDVTNEASWQVLGPIGTVSSGIFTAKLDASTSEYGKGSGAVVATWKDPASGTDILGKTPIFEVGGYVPQDIQREG